MDMLAFATELRKSRWSCGMTPAQLATSAGITAQTVQRAEAGDPDVDLVSLFKMTDALEIELSWLCRFDNQPRLQLVEQMSSHQKQLLLLREQIALNREQQTWRMLKVRKARESAYQTRMTLVSERDALYRSVEELLSNNVGYRIGFKIPSAQPVNQKVNL